MTIRTSAFVLLSFFVFQSVFGQQVLKIASRNPTPEQWLLLTKSRKAISDSDSLNEELVDLVKAFSVDSVLSSKSQRHRVAAAGWVISVFGYKWKALNMTKQKFVGTERDGVSPPNEPPHFTEYDVNFNLIPHTRRYIDLLWPAYVQQRDRNRFHRIKNFDEAPWIYPETLEHINRYRMHCELTPPIHYRAILNEKFYPCVAPNSTREHYNIGSDHATFGVYGPYVADYNHTGHAEIHPYEWLWWYDTHPDRLNQTSQTWFFGYMREASNRFRGWYKKKQPQVGQISVPFVFDLKNDTLNITLDHLVHDLFNAAGISSLKEVPAEASNLHFSKQVFVFDDAGLVKKAIVYSASNLIRQEGARTWISDLNWDKDRNVLTGYVNIGISVMTLYNARLTVE